MSGKKEQEEEEETKAIAEKDQEQQQSYEIPIEVKSDAPDTVSLTQQDEEEEKTTKEEEEAKPKELTIDKLNEFVTQQKESLARCEDKLRHTLADYQNLVRKTKSDIENGVNAKIDQFMMDFIQIYDDFIRAKTFLAEEKLNTEGLDSILKNMDSLLSKYNIKSIDSLGEIFDPNLHEAISIIEDQTLDDNTITKEIRKGYISHERVLRPALVEISKKSKSEKLE